MTKTKTYDPEIHIPVRAAVSASRGTSFLPDHGDPRRLVATREDGSRKEYKVIEVYDPDATPNNPRLGPGAYRMVVLRSTLAEAERFARPEPTTKTA